MTATALLLLVPLAAPPAETSPTARPIAEWVTDLGGEDYAKQRLAYDALLKAGPKAEGAVPELTKLLGKKNVRLDEVAEILGAIGPGARDAVPALLAQLPKEDGGFGYSAEAIARAVARIDGPKPEATRALLLSSGKCQPIFLVGSQTLRDYPAQVIPQVVALCGDKDAKVRAKAATVLATLKDKEPSKVPTQ
jgi:hypothetical protein